MRVLVCGGRDYSNKKVLRVWLGCLHGESEIKAVIHGGAPGADSMAGEWARGMLVSEVCFPAEWDEHGKAAGPIRNAKMLSEGKPDVVLAFPGGRGTADIVQKARAAGVPVIEVKA